MKKKLYKLNKQQKKLMELAGFQMYNYGSVNGDTTDQEFNLAYWKRGELRIYLTRNEPVSLNKLIEYTVRQTQYLDKRRISVSELKPIELS